MITDLAELNNCCITCSNYIQYFALYNNKLRIVSLGECALTRRTKSPLRDFCEKWSKRDFEKEKADMLDDLTVLTNTIQRQIENIVLVLKELFGEPQK